MGGGGWRGWDGGLVEGAGRGVGEENGGGGEKSGVFHLAHLIILFSTKTSCFLCLYPSILR